MKRILLPHEAKLASAHLDSAQQLVAIATVGYSELSGKRTESHDLFRILSKIGFNQVIQFILVVNHALYKKEVADPNLQVGLTTSFLSLDLRTKLGKVWNTRHSARVVFHRQQQLLLLKLAMLWCRRGDRPKWKSNHQHLFGQMCLMVNDLLQSDFDNDQFTDEEARAIVLVTHSDWSHSEDFMETVGRSNHIWKLVADPKVQKQCGSHLDVNDRFLSLFGAPINAFLHVIVGILAQVEKFDLGSTQPWKTVAIAPKTYLSRTAADRNLCMQVFDSLSTDADNYARCSFNRPRQSEGYDFSLLRRYPLIKVDSRHLVCYDPGYMRAFCSDGLYWLLCDGLPSKQAEQFRTLYGQAYECYIQSTMKRAIPSSQIVLPHVYCGPKWSGESGQVCDILVDAGDVLLVVEIKGSLLTCQAKYSGSIQYLKADLRSKFIGTDPRNRRDSSKTKELKGASQLAASIRHLKEGKLPGIQGFSISNFKTIIPVLIAYDPAVVACRGLITSSFAGFMDDISGAPHVGDLIVAGSREVEALEALSSNRSVVETLKSYQSRASRNQSLFEYLVSNHNDAMMRHRTLLYDQAMELLHATLKAFFPNGPVQR